MKRIFIFVIFVIAFLSLSHGQNFSIKNRWNTKLSVSCNRTNEHGGDYFAELDRPLHPIRFRFNVRAECNYGVTNWLEVGGYLGYIRYLNISRHFKGKEAAFAPTFGVNANVHLLPFFGKNKNCRWEWYVTAKYGAAYLINHTPFRAKGISVTSTNHKVQIDEINCSGARYRHIYGIGMGGGVYFKNLFGLYTEVMAGQYSYFPEIVIAKSPYTVRVGIEFKFTSKKTKSKILPEHREIQVE